MIQRDAFTRNQLIKRLSEFFDSPAAGRTLQQKRKTLIDCIEAGGI